jgi:hypothetical protein
MINWAILQITDGTHNGTVSLIDGVDGFTLASTRWDIPDYKGGGIWQSSPFAEGRRLIDKEWDNSIDSFTLHNKGAEQMEAERNLRRLEELLEKASNYWTTSWQDEPVWVERRTKDVEAITQYAIIHRGVLPEMGEFADQLDDKDTLCSGQRAQELLIERGMWLDNPPGEGDCVEASAMECYCYPHYVEFNGLAAPNGTVIDCGSPVKGDDLHSGAFTAEAWIRPTAESYGQGNQGRIFDKDNYAGGGVLTCGWHFLVDSVTGLFASTAAATNAVSRATLNDFYADGEWHHVVMEYDNTGTVWGARTIRIWVDGEEVAYTPPQTAAVGVIVTDAAESLFIGNVKTWAAANARTFDGDIGWTRISDIIRYTTNFTPPPRCEIPPTDANTVWLGIYEGTGTTINDLSGMAVVTNGTMTNGDWGCDCEQCFGNVLGECGPAYLEFNGTAAAGTSVVDCLNPGTLVDLPDTIAGKGDFTIEAWIRPENFGEGNLGRIVDKANMQFHVDSTNGLVGRVVCAGQTAFSYSGLDEFPLGNQWQYVAMTYSEAGVVGGAVARTIYLNINGTWVTSYPGGQTVSIGNYNTDVAANLGIGNEVAGTTRTFGGDIGWVRISDYVRYDPIISGDYTPPARCALPPTDANTLLAVIYEGQGLTTYDRSTNMNNGTITDCTWACDCFPTEGYSEETEILCYPSHLLFNGNLTSGDSNVTVAAAASINDLPSGGKITVDGWMRARNYGEGDLGRIFWKGSIILTLAGPTGAYPGLIGEIACVTTPAISASGLDDITADNEWHYVLMTYDDTAIGPARVIHLNIDGHWLTGDYEVQQAAVGAYTVDNAANLIIGNNAGGTRTFGGRIGWMRYSDSERYDPTAGDFTPPPRCVLPVADANTQLLIIYEGTGATTADLSGNGNDGTISANTTWDCDCSELAAYTGIVREPTCEDEVYFTNKQNIAQLTNIHWYDNSLAVWSPNLISAAIPMPLLPAVPAAAANEAVYFGIDTTLPDSGPFASLVFDLLQGQTDLTIIWEYWNGAWVLLTTQDNTSDLVNTGVNSVHWIPPTGWTPNDPGVGTTGYWMRARVSAIGAAPAPPIQQNRDVYTITWPYIEVQSADIDGDIEAIMRSMLHNQSGAAGGPLAAGTGRIIMGLRSISRGERFAAYINLADEQNDTGITVTVDTIVNAFATLNGAPSGRYVLVGAGAGWIRVAFDSDLVTEYIGRYRVFLRHTQLTAAGDTAQLVIYYGDDDTYSYVGNAIPTLNISNYQVIDFGQIDFPGIEMSATDAVTATMEIITSATNGIRAFDLIMIPVDEWAADMQFRNTNYGGAIPKVDTLEYADIDGFTSPKDGFRAPSRRVATDLITNNFSIKSGGLPILQSNARQRLWYFVQLRTSASDPNALEALPFIAHSAQIEAQQRFESVASDGT